MGSPGRVRFAILLLRKLEDYFCKLPRPSLVHLLRWTVWDRSQFPYSIEYPSRHTRSMLVLSWPLLAEMQLARKELLPMIFSYAPRRLALPAKTFTQQEATRGILLMQVSGLTSSTQAPASLVLGSRYAPVTAPDRPLAEKSRYRSSERKASYHHSQYSS